ncbi:MAG: hypothetical protein ISR77_25070 [Pirellulaceae bacterium]|nr:hypothetical protein [Pirellulaceae bacterium]
MAGQVTNEKLRQLLLDLGFTREQLVKNNNRAFRHPVSRCVIVLPDNRDEDTARAADIAAVRDHLAHQGHLEEAIFDRFMSEGKLPAA